MVMALSLGLPGKMELLVRDALKLAKEFWKDAEGDRLIRLFCYPSAKATWQTHAVEDRGHWGLAHGARFTCRVRSHSARRREG